MKTSVIISSICLSLMATFSMNAQEEMPVSPSATDSRNKIFFGIKGGATNSNVFDEQGEEFRPRPKYGFAAGVFAALPIGKYLGVQPEVALSQRGFYATGMSLGYKYNFTRTTTYLDIPIQLALKPSPYISIVAGPQYSYLLKQHDVFEDEYVTTEQVQEFENDDIRKNVLGATVGLDVNINHFVFAGRYSWDLQRNNADGSSDTPRYKNVWLQGSIGLRF